MAVITISRQLGSGGSDVARLVAGELGYRLLDRELIDTAAEQAGVSPDVARCLDEQAHGWAYGLTYSLLLGFQGHPVSEESYRIQVSRLIREAAAADDVVIVGRGGQAVLAGRPNVCHVHVVAPLADRIARVVTTRAVGPDDARRLIHDSDECRRRYVHGINQRDWNDATLYDLILNTHLLSFEVAAQLVVDGARRLGARAPRPILREAQSTWSGPARDAVPARRPAYG